MQSAWPSVPGETSLNFSALNVVISIAHLIQLITLSNIGFPLRKKPYESNTAAGSDFTLMSYLIRGA
jgi:hypothetical protein